MVLCNAARQLPTIFCDHASTSKITHEIVAVTQDCGIFYGLHMLIFFCMAAGFNPDWHLASQLTMILSDPGRCKASTRCQRLSGGAIY